MLIFVEGKEPCDHHTVLQGWAVVPFYARLLQESFPRIGAMVLGYGPETSRTPWFVQHRDGANYVTYVSTIWLT